TCTGCLSTDCPSVGSATGTCDNYCSSGPHSSACCGSTISIDASGSTPSACYVTETIATDFSDSGTQPPQPTAVGPTDSSPANDVNNYNAKNTLGLLTCPAAPNPNPTDNSFFYTGEVANLAGDACYKRARR